MLSQTVELPGANCGVCGYRTCDALAAELERKPDLINRCLTRAANVIEPADKAVSARSHIAEDLDRPAQDSRATLRDSLDREFDFYLEHFPEDPGPKEIIIPHNPMLTRELEISVGDLMVGRPLGMSCGCPITHCGVVVEVDRRTGVIVWCVTGPLGPRNKGFKDIGYYIAEGYEGLITDARVDIKIGMRYFFQPRRCMLQWRHSGLVNYINKSKDGLQVRLEGLWIG
ncbi:putative Fe-S cluster-containing protein [Rhodoblastus sphagnicola]|nr:(Fe-S)-binding protein [Rhodoblastus sphagnicola]MBB4198523.1 putative Fe-S cluster-containing protein [Rhodoblastus sphagnicola]